MIADWKFTRNGLEASSEIDVEPQRIHRPQRSRVSWLARLTLHLFEQLTSLPYADSSPTQFSSALTTLFETLALIISQHEAVVAKYYGRRKIDRVALALVKEADLIGTRLMDRWRDERDIKRLKDEVRLALAASGSSTSGSATNAASAVATTSEETLDPRRIDGLLGEMALMSGRWQLLRRFLYDRVGPNAVVSDRVYRVTSPLFKRHLITIAYAVRRRG